MKLFFSPGAICLIWLPVIGGCGILTLYPGRWYVGLAAFGGAALMFLMFLGGQAEHTLTTNEAQDADITAYRDNLRYQRQTLLGQLGRPANSGDWNAQQKAIWTQIHALERQEADFLKETKVINLDPLGHNVGLVYRNPKAAEQTQSKTAPKARRAGA